MSRVGVLLLLLLATPAWGEPPVTSPGFNAALTTRIYAAGLNFIAPRALDAVSIPQLAIWGLRGLTALDADLIASETGGRLVLGTAQRVIYAATPPAQPTAEAWAAAATAMAQAAWQTSAAVRRAGTQGIVQSFFDELFNHLDPYSRYVRPGLAAEEEAERQGSAGAGLTLVRGHRAVVVATVVPDGPAASAGIRAGDRIIAVDGQSVAAQQPATVAARIAGPDGSRVRITWRGRDGRRRQADLERAVVPPQTVFADRVADMVVLRLTGFSRSTAIGFAEPVAKALESHRPPDGIVIDLRGNRGGLLTEAVTVADELLPAGIVAIEQGRDPAANRIWTSASGELAKDVPVVVLVDGRTGSASEILAAALSDRGRAVVVGSSTLGKGLVQTFTTLPDGGELFVTWSRVLAPRGWPIQGLGVLPQVCTSLGEDALERQLQALADGVQPMAAAIARARAARPTVPAAEMVAIRSACPASEGHDVDLDVAHFLIDNPAAYAAALLPPLRGR
ncbi:MAG TPA: S41 family peptidase [Acetobacteraceae bacterium]|nr:S41 family peptidase [Acetobacteraceae bacterium]